MSEFKIEKYDELFSAVLKLDNIDECRRFFEDAFTVNELEAICQRVQVAALLNEGCSYNDISEKTGASTATISRVNKCLHYGAGGYEVVLNKKGKENE
ncbi:MAG: TrpR-like protein YerC/YecD [Clostridia bacterium]|nr:TrpR-like protein YerC/YecD [Clostridia bacterium]